MSCGRMLAAGALRLAAQRAVVLRAREASAHGCGANAAANAWASPARKRLWATPAARQLDKLDDDEPKAPAPPQPSVAERVMKVVSSFEKVKQEKVNESAHFVNDLGLDSLDTVELVMNFEDEFKIEIPDKDADSIMSVTDAIAYLKGRSDIDA
uniref:Acyl carrier protein n=1 Tax=Erythrolobus australicus TaxID=1077150 RepID=A0A7S1XJI3_9RHOD|mmetsp:Transcript_455/g.1184  ORF Transcript_455/g.1184 Transcript_455/m.1184 type:complete len:154 (+) Transcript_455:17-478(+)